MLIISYVSKRNLCSRHEMIRCPLPVYVGHVTSLLNISSLDIPRGWVCVTTDIMASYVFSTETLTRLPTD